MNKFKSRKLWVSLAGLVLIGVSGPLGLGTAAVGAIGAIVAAYVGGQAWQDSRRPSEEETNAVYDAGFCNGYQSRGQDQYEYDYEDEQ